MEREQESAGQPARQQVATRRLDESGGAFMIASYERPEAARLIAARMRT